MLYNVQYPSLQQSHVIKKMPGHSSQLISDTMTPYGLGTKGEVAEVRTLETTPELDLGIVMVFMGGELEGW